MVISKEEQLRIQKKYTDLIQSKSNGAIPLFIVVVGSQAFGTNVPSSDFDYSGVFLQSQEDIYGFNYLEQIDEKKEKGDFGNSEKDDAVFYEVKRFLQLLQTANPTVLSILFSPTDCIVYKHPIFDLILKQREKFVTKLCKNSFAGYAIAQCRKAKGLDKMQNWEKDKVTRKEVLDFCYVIDGSKSIPWKKWNESKGFEEKFCGVVNVPNARDLYAVYFDDNAYKSFSESFPRNKREKNKENLRLDGKPMGYGYKGISKCGVGLNVAESNQLRLSSIPKGEIPIANISFNKDGYTAHCKDYKSYVDWLENRNKQRYVDNKGHNQKIDSKNIMHLVRLLRMSREIAESGDFVIRRPDADYLKSVRRGEVNLQDIIDWAEEEILLIDDLFLNSNLPDKMEKEFVNDLLVEIRNVAYK